MNHEGIAILTLTTSVVAAYVSNIGMRPSDMPDLIKSVHGALSGVVTSTAVDESEKVALPTSAEIRKSITPNALISFIDGKPYKMLKRHLTTRGLTIEEYKAKFRLPQDYPTTARAYSDARSKLALAVGLGRNRHKAAHP